MRRNLFIGIPNDKLKECFESYKRVQCNRKQDEELFEELALEYETIVECEESKRKVAANVICSNDMFYEIARRYFKIYDVVKDKDFCELFGIKIEDRDLK